MWFNRRQVLRGSLSLTLASGVGEKVLASTDQALYVPPEEGPHERTFMQWPSSLAVYGDRYFLNLTQHAIADVANAIAEFEPVMMLAAAEDHGKARKLLSATVELWDVPTEDLWCRDSGPLFAWRGKEELVVSHIAFNGWGGKQIHTRDARVAMRVAERLGLSVVDSGLVGEPGGVEHDGQGLLLAHESCWVNANRNGNQRRDAIEAKLLAAYGADRMIWSPGLKGEDITDYHIDALARLTGPGRVLMNLPEAPAKNNPFHHAALETHDKLIAEGLNVEVIPEPNERRVKSDDFVASYVNYYVCNGAVIASQFGDQRTDEIARDAFTRHFPGREIVMMDVDILGELGGGIHCATQQMPA